MKISEMDKGLKILIALLLSAIVLLFIIQHNASEQIDWSPNFKTSSKSPLGLYILDREMENLFPYTNIERWHKSFYEYYDGYEDDTYIDQSIIIINHSFYVDKASADKLFNFVQAGNHVFISAWDIDPVILDTLRLEIMDYSDSDSIELSILSEKVPQDINEKIKIFKGACFDVDSTETFNILGQACTEAEGYSKNYIQVPFGKGTFLLHLEPAIFTNYGLLKENYFKHTEAIFSFLSQKNIIWLLQGQSDGDVSTSPLRFIRSKPMLNMAWNLLIWGLILFMIFNAKRKQRIIPEIVPPVNSTTDFVKTISNLYAQEGSTRELMDKMIIYTLERIRSAWMVPTDKLDKEFERKLTIKSGKAKKDIEKLVFLITKHQDTDYICSPDDLIRLNRAIEKIF
ncbi:MAG: DUF4350 domain-containing protein [Saprospiraceae bacterium]|nr:DUF4350 domain-containing protein [Saprospiraceae bacterium]